MNVFPKVGRDAEKPGDFPASRGSWSTRKEEGPGVTCEAEIRMARGGWRERVADSSHCSPTRLGKAKAIPQPCLEDGVVSRLLGWSVLSEGDACGVDSVCISLGVIHSCF